MATREQYSKILHNDPLDYTIDVHVHDLQ